MFLNITKLRVKFELNEIDDVIIYGFFLMKSAKIENVVIESVVMEAFF